MSSSVVLPSWPALLVEAVTSPGVISDAYFRFWNYSPGNQLLALFQCAQRGLDLGPINTFHGWRELGRCVRRGEKAITLCMPVTIRRKRKVTEGDDRPKGDAADQPPEVCVVTRFLYRPHWFVLCQTEGRDYVPMAVPEWDEEAAMRELQLERIAFKHPDGNAQGYAQGRAVAVSPVAFMPYRTLLHEIAHVVLGHTAELTQLTDGEGRTPRDVREVEAECVAMLCSCALGLDGAEFSRGYIQHWLNGNAITDRSAQKVFRAADAILKAGRACAQPAITPALSGEQTAS